MHDNTKAGQITCLETEDRRCPCGAVLARDAGPHPECLEVAERLAQQNLPATLRELMAGALPKRKAEGVLMVKHGMAGGPMRSTSFHFRYEPGRCVCGAEAESPSIECVRALATVRAKKRAKDLAAKAFPQAEPPVGVPTPPEHLMGVNSVVRGVPGPCEHRAKSTVLNGWRCDECGLMNQSSAAHADDCANPTPHTAGPRCLDKDHVGKCGPGLNGSPLVGEDAPVLVLNKTEAPPPNVACKALKYGALSDYAMQREQALKDASNAYGSLSLQEMLDAEWNKALDAVADHFLGRKGEPRFDGAAGLALQLFNLKRRG